MNLSPIGGPAVTTSGAIPPGYRDVLFIFSSDYTGNVASTAYTGADGSIEFSSNPPDTLGSIDYTVTTGSIRIVSIIGYHN